MKRFLGILFAVMLIAVLSVAANAAEVRTVYLDPAKGADTNSGVEEAAPVQTVEAAYAALSGAQEGRIVMLSTLSLTADTTFPACDIPVTITSKTGAEGFSSGSHLFFSGDTTLENLTLTLTATSNAKYLSGEGHDLTIGTGVTTQSTDKTSRFCLSTHKTAGDNGSATLTVKSGYWRNIFVGGHTSENTGNATLIMSGGDVNNLVGPTFSGKLTGNTTMIITGGTINVLMAGANESGWVKGNVDITLSGGTINKVRMRRVINSKDIPVNGTVTLNIDGDCSKVKNILDESASGTIDKTVLVLKSGKLAVTPTAKFDEVRVEIPQDKTMTLNGVTIAADSVNSAGTLIFTGAAKLTADSITGTLNCQISDTVKENHPYVTAPADSIVVFPAQSGVTGKNGVWQYAVGFDKENFKGLVLTTSVDGISVKLYKGFSTSDSNLLTPVYEEGRDRYYEVTAGSKYYLIAKPESGYARYNDHYNLYITEQEAQTKTVMDVTPDVRSTNGWDPSSEIRHRTDEVMDTVYPSDASLWPQYAEVFTTPAFGENRNTNMQTTQTEMEAYIAGLDDEEDNMYVYSLGTSAGKAFDIPLVIFTTVDLSQATTLEEAAALIRADSQKNNKLTVQHQAQIHGNEQAAGEAALGMLKRLDGAYGKGLLDTMNIYVIPRLNPYGAYKSQRGVSVNGSTVDPNRDFMNLQSAETQARMRAYNLFDPEVVFDSHEYQEALTSSSHNRKDLMLCTHFLPNHSQIYQDTAMDLAYAAFGQLTKDGLYYSWYSDSVGGIGANTGSSNTAFRNALHVLMETSGIYQGLLQYERRVATHISALTGIYEYLDANAAEVKRVVRAEQEAVVENGKTYRQDDVVILDGATTDLEENRIVGKTVNLATGALTDAVYSAYTPDTIKRSRIAPTAYLIPAGESYTDQVLALAEKHGISYSFLPANSAVMLQQYIGTVTAAQLTEERQVHFPNGAYVFTMNQVDAYILAVLMEVDVNDTVENKGTLAQMGIIQATDGKFPVYRYIHDLNENDYIDYITLEKPVVVYLKQGAADDTGDGLTEDTAVKTLATAFEKLKALMADAPAGTVAKLILLDTYSMDLASGKVTFPTHSYPVEITAKTATDGLKFLGSSTDENKNIVALGGDTTFYHMTLTLSSSNTKNHFLTGAGHKFVVGREVTCATAGEGELFSICGGGYSGTYNQVDVTLLSGSWEALNLGNFASGTIKGDMHLTVDGAYISGTIRSSYKNAATNGNVYMDLQNITGTGSIYGGASNSGKNYGSLTIRLGENISKTNVYACASNSTIGAATTFTVIADGVDLTKVNIRGRSATSDGVTQYLPCTLIVKKGELADVIDTFVCRGDATVILGRRQKTEAAATKSFYLDLNGYNGILSVADGVTVTVSDSQTDDYTVLNNWGYGELTATGNVVAKEGYVCLGGKSYHRFNQGISSVALRTSVAGIYYGAVWQCDEVLAAQIASYGVALSAKNMPDAGFAADSDTLYTQMAGNTFRSGQKSTSVLVEDIFKTDADNDTRGKMPVYALSYVTLSDGRTLVSDGVSYSLYDVMHLLDAYAYEENSIALDDFYNTWKVPMETWELTNIGKK